MYICWKSDSFLYALSKGNKPVRIKGLVPIHELGLKSYKSKACGEKFIAKLNSLNESNPNVRFLLMTEDEIKEALNPVSKAPNFMVFLDSSIIDLQLIEPSQFSSLFLGFYQRGFFRSEEETTYRALEFLHDGCSTFGVFDSEGVTKLQNLLSEICSACDISDLVKFDVVPLEESH